MCQSKSSGMAWGWGGETWDLFSSMSDSRMVEYWCFGVETVAAKERDEDKSQRSKTAHKRQKR
jgi:hypothetical protein